MKKPKQLKKGDKVAIVSLSSGIAGDEEFKYKYELGKKRLEIDFGLNVITMPNALKGSEFLKLNPQLRAKDLMDAFKDETIKAIICNIGGDDTIRLLPYIDFDIIKNNPKIFMGYSDTTINHFMMNKASLVSYYGPSVMAEFGENVKMHSYTFNAVNSVLFNNSVNYVIKSSDCWTSEKLLWSDRKNDNISRKMVNEIKSIEILQSNGDICGELLGGCVDTFHMFIGSEIWPSNWKNKILVLETSEDQPDPDFIAQILRHPSMKEALSQIKGIIIGKPVDEKYYDEYKKMYLSVIKEEYNLKNLFIGYNYNFGHTSPMNILPFGIKVKIDSKTGEITFLESATEAE